MDFALQQDVEAVCGIVNAIDVLANLCPAVFDPVAYLQQRLEVFGNGFEIGFYFEVICDCSALFLCPVEGRPCGEQGDETFVLND